MKYTALLACVIGAIAVACSEGDEASAPSGPSATAYPLLGAANEEPHDGPKGAGQFQFLYETWGTEVLDSWPPADFMLSLMTREPEVFGNQYEKFGFIRDEHDEFPVGLKRGTADRTKVHETCAQCHVGHLPDQRLWLGAPNVALDMGRFQVEVNRRWVASGHAPFLTPLQEKKALLLGPGRFNAETNTYEEVVPADFPVYFELGKRSHLNYLGTGRTVRTEAYFSIYSFGAGAPNAATAKVPFPSDAQLTPFLDFFGNIHAPSAPAQDAANVARGQAVFAEARCNGCHHVDDIGLDDVVTLDKSPDTAERYPGDDPEFPNGSVRTSSQHSIIQDPTSPANVDRGYIDLINFMKEHKLKAGASDGYRPSDLHGVWASAPYLHNGSVPSLEALLDPASQRPKQFPRGTFTVDTQYLGNDNQGHEFGTTLPAADKLALVAYLRSL